MRRTSRGCLASGVSVAVDLERSAGRLGYQDTAYYFCSLACAGEFARHPERFAT